MANLYKTLVVAIVLGFSSIAAANAQYTLTILHNNDGESRLTGLSESDTARFFGGIGEFISVVDSLRTIGDNQDATLDSGVVVLSSGDNYLASAAFQASQQRIANNPSANYYDAEALDLVGYDALCLGNHDFDFGPQVLADFIGDFTNSQPTFLSANLDFQNEPALAPLAASGDIAPTINITINGTNVGVIGISPANLASISSPGNVGIGQAIADTVNKYATELTNDGADIIIVVSHQQSITLDTALAAMLSDVDVIIAGGGDELLYTGTGAAADSAQDLIPTNGGGIPTPDDVYPIVKQDMDGDDVLIVTTTGNYGYVGRLVVEFDASGAITSFNGNPVRVTNAPNASDRVIGDAAGEAIEDSVRAFIDNQDSIILATTEVDIDSRRPSVRGQNFLDVNAGNLVADAFLRVAQGRAPGLGAPVPNVVVQNGGGIRLDEITPAGDSLAVTWANGMLPFSNRVVVTDSMPIQQFKEILEQAYRFDPSASGAFTQIAGFTVLLDTSRTAQEVDDNDPNLPVTTAGERVRELVLENGDTLIKDGAIVDADAKVIVVTNSFTADLNGDNLPFRGISYTNVAAQYAEPLTVYLRDSLNGVVTAAMYPTEGDDRINDVSLIGVQEASNINFFSAYPNPVSSQLNLSYGLPVNSNVTVELIDIAGRTVATAVNARQNAGEYRASIAVDGLSAGLYFARLTVNGQTEISKIIVR